jgi:hypothetical protein
VLYDPFWENHPREFLVETISAGAVPVKPVGRLTLIGLFSVAVSVVLFCVTLDVLDRPILAVAWGSWALATYIAGLLFLVSALNYNSLGLASWRVGPWMLFWFAIVFGIATLTWTKQQTGVPGEIAISDVLRALWMVAVGMSCWVAGYSVGPGRPLRSFAVRSVGLVHRRFADNVRSLKSPWVLFTVGIGANFATVATTGRFGYVGNTSSVMAPTGYGALLGALSECAPLAIATASLQAFRERSRGALLTLIALFLIEISLGALAGGKESFVVAVLAVAIPFSAARRRLPRLALAVLVLIFLIVVVPFNQAYRNVVRQGSARLTPIAAGPAVLREVVTGNSPATLVPNSIDYLARRVREIDNVAIIAQRAPRQVAFLSPVQLLIAPVEGMVPRAIWSGKPVRTQGLTFSQQFYELPPTTSSTETIIGGLYWFGGWIPLIGGMFVLGCAVRLLDSALDVRSNPHAIFLVLLLFPTLVGGEEDWVSILAAIPATMLVWLAAIFLVFPRRGSPLGLASTVAHPPSATCWDT